MLLITKVEYHQTDKDFAELITLVGDPNVSNINMNGDYVKQEVIIEAIHGRRFNNPITSEQVIVGATREVQEILGLMYGSWDDLERSYIKSYTDLNTCKRNLESANERIEGLKAASFFTRLKWLFTGVK